jgi:gag-polyprotein putative aspartyl protease
MCDFGARMIKPAPVAFLLFALLPCLSAVADEPVTIPFRFADGFIRVEVQLASVSKPLSMLLDSGASVSVLNLATARRLQLQTGRSIAVQGVASDSHAYGISPMATTISGVDCGSITLAADMNNADELCSEPVDGLIGADFFRNRIVQIDYAQQRLRILSHSPKPAAAHRLPVKVINDVACVGVGVNGSSLRWTRLDTGCNDSLHWVIPKLTRRGKQHGASIGFITDSRDLAPSRVALGKCILDSIPVSLHGCPFFEGEAGLLGNELLSRFTVTLDWPGKTLILQERRD